MRLTWLGLPVLLLAGCVTTESNKQAFADLKNAPLCCSSMAEIPVKSLPVGQDHRFEISSTSPVFEFAGKKSYFEAFELPSGSGMQLSLRSFLAYAPTTPTQPVFHPSLMFLDENKQPVGRIVSHASFRPARAGWVEGPGLEANLDMDTLGARARYMVVFTELNDLQGGRPLPVPNSTTPVMVGNVVMPINSGGGTALSEPTPTGSLRLTLRPKRQSEYRAVP